MIPMRTLKRSLTRALRSRRPVLRLDDITDALSEGRGLEPFTPRYIGHFAESDFLELFGELLPFRVIGCSNLVGDEFLKLRDVWPAVPCARASPGQAKVNSGIIYVRGQPPREKE